MNIAPNDSGLSIGRSGTISKEEPPSSCAMDVGRREILRRGTVKIKWSGKLIGAFRFAIDGTRIYLSRPQFESDVEAMPYDMVADLRVIVRRHCREWAKDTRYSFFETEDRQIETQFCEI